MPHMQQQRGSSRLLQRDGALAFIGEHTARTVRGTHVVALEHQDSGIPQPPSHQCGGQIGDCLVKGADLCLDDQAIAVAILACRPLAMKPLATVIMLVARPGAVGTARGTRPLLLVHLEVLLGNLERTVHL